MGLYGVAAGKELGGNPLGSLHEWQPRRAHVSMRPLTPVSKGPLSESIPTWPRWAEGKLRDVRMQSISAVTE